MATNTNFQNLKTLLEKYKPESKGIVTGAEQHLIEDTLEIKSMEFLELRNLRDFVVLYLSRQSAYADGPAMLDITDKTSAITAVIDQAIVGKGGEP